MHIYIYIYIYNLFAEAQILAKIQAAAAIVENENST